MVQFEIDNKTYQMRSTWSDITIADMQKLAAIEMPKRLMLIFSAYERDMQSLSVKVAGTPPGSKMTVAAEFEWPEYTKTLEDTKQKEWEKITLYYGQYLSVLSTVPDEVISKINKESMQYLADYCSLSEIARAVYLGYIDGHATEEFSGFEHNGRKYILPKAKEILNDTLPAYYEPSIKLIESLNAETMKIKGLALLIAIWSREENERGYSEESTLARVQEFQSLKMSVAWEVFFSIVGLNTIFLKIMSSSFGKAVETIREKSITSLN